MFTFFDTFSIKLFIVDLACANSLPIEPVASRQKHTSIIPNAGSGSVSPYFIFLLILTNPEHSEAFFPFLKVVLFASIGSKLELPENEKIPVPSGAGENVKSGGFAGDIDVKSDGFFKLFALLDFTVFFSTFFKVVFRASLFCEIGFLTFLFFDLVIPFLPA